MGQEQFVVARVRAETTGQGGAVYRRVTFVSGAHGVMRDGRVLMYSDNEAAAIENFDLLVGKAGPSLKQRGRRRRRRSGGG